MMTHTFRIIAAVAGIMLLTLLPFIPGGYDSLAIPLSTMAQFVGFVALIVVPVGAIWLAFGLSSRLSSKQYGIAIAALVLSTIVWLLVCVAALVSSGFALAVGTLVFGIFMIWRMAGRLKSLKGPEPRPVSPAALYLLIIPAAVALLQRATVAPAMEFSRTRAIENAASLIADIERYRAANGRYPASLLSVWPDFKPGLMGIKDYQYEPKGEAYNVVFEQMALAFGTREFDVYNPRDEQAATSHKSDLLQLTPEQLVLEQTRGHYAVRDGPRPHWKYFLFD